MNKYFQGMMWSLLAGSISTYGWAKPIFLVTPNVSAQSSLISGETGSAVYQVTNNTPHTLSNIGLVMPTGITPNTASVSQYSDYCTNPFTLSPGGNCLVKVSLNSSQLGSGVSNGPIVCYTASHPVYCSQPFKPDQMNTTITHGSIPADCNSNYSNFNYELSQNFDSMNSIDFTTGWGPGRANLPLSPSNPDLTHCPSTGGVSWERQRVIAAAQFWIPQKLNYCHHYNPDYSTPASGQGASLTQAGYCNPALDMMPGSVYYNQQARWNYTGEGSETAYNWVNNNQMWYGMDCSNTTSFIYNFSFGNNSSLGIPFNSKTSSQGGQCTNIAGSVDNNCPNGQDQDHLSPNQQVAGNAAYVLNNPGEAGYLVCADGSIDPYSNSNVNSGSNLNPSMCSSHGGYLSRIDSSGCFSRNYTANQLSKYLQPGDLLYIAGNGVTCGGPPDPQPQPDGSKSDVTHVVMWLDKQVGYGSNDIDPSLIAPNDIPDCTSQSVWGPQIGDWVIADSHYQGYDYRVLTPCFYINNLWGVRRVIT